jgi:hypothetical protein
MKKMCPRTKKHFCNTNATNFVECISWSSDSARSLKIYDRIQQNTTNNDDRIRCDTIIYDCRTRPFNTPTVNDVRIRSYFGGVFSEYIQNSLIVLYICHFLYICRVEVILNQLNIKQLSIYLSY